MLWFFKIINYYQSLLYKGGEIMNKKYIMSIAIIVAGVVLTTSIASALTWSPPIEIGWGVEHDYETHAVTDRFGQVHVVWSTYPSYTRLYYNRFDGTQWTGAERIGGATWWVSGPRVAVDAAGNPHVLWNGIPGGGDSQDSLHPF